MSFLNKIKKGVGFQIPGEDKTKEQSKEKKTKRGGKPSSVLSTDKAVKGKPAYVKATVDKEWFEPEGELAVDVYQTPKYFIIEAPVAGIRTEDLDITIETDTIKIKGKRERPQKIKNENYLVQECYWGSFSREIILPQELDGSKTDASIHEGILIIKIPKIEEQEKQKIKIKEK